MYKKEAKYQKVPSLRAFWYLAFAEDTILNHRLITMFCSNARICELRVKDRGLGRAEVLRI